MWKMFVLSVASAASAASQAASSAASEASSAAQLTTGEKWELSLSTTLTGLVIVFAVLIFLTWIIDLFGKTASAIEKRNAKNRPPEAGEKIPESAVAVISAPETATAADDDEIMAVIAAAVYSYGQQTGKQYAVTGVKRAAVRGNGGRRSAWAASGVAENVKPF